MIIVGANLRVSPHCIFIYKNGITSVLARKTERDSLSFQFSLRTYKRRSRAVKAEKYK